MSKFFGHFSSINDIATEFSGDLRSNGYSGDTVASVTKQEILNELKGSKLLFACYGTPAYEGQALVLYEKDGKLFEVNGGHCSCYGLEGQWAPEETSWTALKGRQFYGLYDEAPGSAEALKKLIDKNVN